MSPSTAAPSSQKTTTQIVATKVAATPSIGNSYGKQLLIKNKDGQTMTVLQQKSSTITPRPEVKFETIKKPLVASVAASSSSDEPPTKKIKCITLSTAQINQIQGEKSYLFQPIIFHSNPIGATIMQKEGENRKIVMLPSNYVEQLEKLKKQSNSNESSINKSTQGANIKMEAEKSQSESIDEDGKKY